MEELQRKTSQRAEAGKPRKVRFKIASSYSGRVLKHVYEDGQELDSPGEKYPHSFIHSKLPQHLDVGQLCGFQGSPTGLIAQRINVYRGLTSYRPPAYGAVSTTDSKPPVLDFGKIIIYTSNLRIIRSPQRREDMLKVSLQSPEGGDNYSQGQDKGVVSVQQSSLRAHGEEENLHPADKDDSSCPQCGGSGCTPCSLCHGSKLSMLANRFNESIRALRCPACDPDGLQRCGSCAVQHPGKY